MNTKKIPLQSLCWLILAGLLVGTPGIGSRTVILPPVKMSSRGGGTLADPSSNQRVCWATDMSIKTTDPLVANNGFNGICGLWHKIGITLSNLSNFNQTVSLVVLAGTGIQSNNSSGNTQILPLTTGPSASVSADTTAETITMGANEIHELELWANCSSASCVLSTLHLSNTSDTPNYLVGSSSSSPSCPPDTFQICIRQTTTALLKITVAEDRGAVSGVISSVHGRQSGRNVIADTAPNNVLINGGRAF